MSKVKGSVFYGGLCVLYAVLSFVLLVGCVGNSTINTVYSDECEQWVINPGHYEVSGYHYLGDQAVVFDVRTYEYYTEEYWLSMYNDIVQERNEYNLNIGVWIRVIYNGETVGYVLSDGVHFLSEDALYIDNRVERGE